MKKYVVLILIMFAFFATQLTNQSYAKYSNNEDITNELKSQGLIDVNEKQIELKGKEKEEFSKLNNVPDEATVTESGQNEYAICNGELSYFDGLDDYIDILLVQERKLKSTASSESIDEERIKKYVSGLGDLINDLEKYEITEIMESLDNFIDVKLERKDREYDGLKIDNPFDSIYLTLGKDNYKLVYLINNKKLNIDDTGLKVDKEKAITVAKDFISREYHSNATISDIYLKVKEINNPVIEENRDLISKIFDDNLFLSYEVEFSDGTKINLDYNNYKVIDINSYKNSTSFYDRQKNMYNWKTQKA